MQLNGAEQAFTWYRDENQQPFISLQSLATAAGWDYAPGAACMVLGREIMATYDGGGISALTVDGQPQNGNARVWEGDLYVNFAFLQALGADASASGDTVSITFPQ